MTDIDKPVDTCVPELRATFAAAAKISPDRVLRAWRRQREGFFTMLFIVRGPISRSVFQQAIDELRPFAEKDGSRSFVRVLFEERYVVDGEQTGGWGMMKDGFVFGCLASFAEVPEGSLGTQACQHGCVVP